MKTNHWTKTIGVLLLSLGLFKPASGFAQTLSVQSGSAIDVAQSAQPDSIVQLTADAQGLSLLSPDAVPASGTFWLVMPGIDGGVTAPMPCPPKDTSLPIYQIVNGQFLVDATGGQVAVSPELVGRRIAASTVTDALEQEASSVVNLITRIQTSAADQQTRATIQAMGMDVPSPGDGGTNSFTPDGVSYIAPDYGTNLWIAQVSLSSGNLVGIMSNSLADVSYEIQSRTNLLQTNWNSEVAPVYGSEMTNWTPLSMAMNNRANLFLRIRSLIDSANVGIPDWWQLQYFGYVGINPYAASPAGDGFNIFSKYQSGLAPTTFVTPPAPNNFIAVLSTNGTDVLLSWNSAQGAVTNYAIYRGVWDGNTYDYDYSQIGTVNANSTAFTDVGGLAAGGGVDPVYELAAVYSGGNSSQTASSYLYYSPPSPPTPPTPIYNIYVAATLVRNATGRWQLMFTDLSANAQIIQLTWTDSNWNTTTQNISAGSLTNGVYQIPDADAVNFLGDSLSVQGMDTNGEAGEIVQVGTLPDDAPYFVDGRQHLKQNLNFAIRAASIYQPYGATYYWFKQLNASTNFEEFSFLYHDSDDYNLSTWSALDDLWPFTANYNLANYLMDTTRTNFFIGSTNFNFQPDFTTNIPAPPILNHADPCWIVQPGFYSNPWNPYDTLVTTTNWGVTLANYNSIASLQNGIYNLFGLPYETSYALDYIRNGWPDWAVIYQSLSLGDTITAESTNDGHSFLGYASQCPAPMLQFVNYYFAPLINPYADTLNLPPVDAQPLPLPIDDSFNVTNQTPTVMLGAVGQPMILGGWAKYAIQNGNPNKFAYLGQYFVTNAFLLNTYGTITTNSAGILSPYGEFFPTQAGRARLVTMPDIDPPYKQGTCTVSIVSLNVDANHDGTMDLSYFGHDQTSPSKPYVFWCNNNFDRWHTVDGTDHEQDDMPPQSAPDCNYTVGGTRVIPCARDLEDFSRLWISGVTSNLLAALPYGSTVTLNWGDVSNPNSSNPTIDLFQAADTDGGTGYLTNSTIAAQQTNNTQCLYIGRLAPGGSLQLNAIQFNNIWAGNYFIWCGVTNGSGQLSLTFSDVSGRVLGQASVYIQVVDIKQMYERWTVGDITTIPPATTAYLAGDLPSDMTQSFQYNTLATANTPYILFVHGWNLPLWEKDRYAETAFKRLYWQGYQGRFGEFRWPTFSGFPFGEFSSQAVNPRNFDNSEYNAWLSGTGLLNKLNDLNSAYPGNVYLIAHSLGNVVAGEALRLAGNNQLVNTYIAMQGALAAHCYDPTTANRSGTFSTPDRYAQYYINGAPCYFNGSAGAGTYVNFFNTNDYALHSSTFSWEYDQNHKPDHGVAGFSIPYPGYYYSVSSQHPNGFYAQLGSGTNDYQNFNFPGDTYTIFAYCDQARSYALGAQANVGGAFKTLTYHQVDLTLDPIDFSTAHKYHSGEFRSDNAYRWQFWDQVLFQMRLKQQL
jgi:hypothetical protein